MNNPTMGTSSTGLDKKNLNTIYCLFSKWKMLENAKLRKIKIFTNTEKRPTATLLLED